MPQAEEQPSTAARRAACICSGPAKSHLPSAPAPPAPGVAPPGPVVPFQADLVCAQSSPRIHTSHGAMAWP